ncbi:MAG: zinc-ribbon domain-containing protein [Robiginitalea sp.]
MFILFLGTRPGKKREAPLSGVTCPYCGQIGQLYATVVPQYIHLFWIPVYRLRPMAYVECGHCKKMYEGSDLTPQMRAALQELKAK